MNIAAISLTPHDLSLCILKDGEIYENTLEERLSTFKKDGVQYFIYDRLGKFAYEYGLDKLFISNGSDEDYKLTEQYLDKYQINCPVDYILEEHHLYHASSAFYASGFDEAACLVMDGWGACHKLQNIIEDHTNINIDSYNQELDESRTKALFAESSSVYMVKDHQFEPVCKHYYVSPEFYAEDTHMSSVLTSQEYYSQIAEHHGLEFSHCFGIGMMYGTLSEYLGFDRENCGKTMGLSAFGKEDPELPSFVEENKLYGNPSLFYYTTNFNGGYHPSLIHNNDFQKRANIAYKLQKSVEEAIIIRVGNILENYPDTKNIVFSGGVALNICANSAVKEKYPDLNFFADPIASDACQAFGMAQYHNPNKKEYKPLESIYLGPKYDLQMKKLDIEIAVAKGNKIMYNKNMNKE